MVEADGLPRRPFYRRRPCACCCLVFSSLVLVVAIIIVILAFTLFKPKEAEVSVEKVDLLGLNADLGTTSGIIPIPAVNVTLGVLVSVYNPNRASLKYANSSAMVYYHGDEVAVAPIPAGSIGSQGTENISTVLVVLADQLVTNSHLVGDALSGSLPFTTKTKLSGRVKVIFIKHHVDITSQCSVSVSIANRSLTDNGCDNDVDL